jgi:hypothetical protein
MQLKGGFGGIRSLHLIGFYRQSFKGYQSAVMGLCNLSGHRNLSCVSKKSGHSTIGLQGK